MKTNELSLKHPTLSEIQDAHLRIKEMIHHTPVLTNQAFDRMAGVTTFFKCENFQKVGAFKFRGASHAVSRLDADQLQKGVVTHSSGNHAQALALAAKIRGIPAYIVMPSNSPEVKKAAVKGYGGQITFCEPTLSARESTVKEIIQRTSAHFIHPFDDPQIISGQGTAALELINAQPDLDVIVAPVGGGGLLSGTAIAAKGLNPRIQVIGAEPEAADDAFRSHKEGVLYPSNNPKTIADGLLTSLSDLTFSVIRKHVDEIVTVSEVEIQFAMKFILERLKIVIEPSAAVSVAAVLKKKFSNKTLKVGVILSGGNFDFNRILQ